MEKELNFDDLEECGAFAILRSPDSFFSSANYWDERYIRESKNKKEETSFITEWCIAQISA
jgi:hypothetical protein